MKRIGVFTSGGDSPGMNAAVRAVVRTALHEDVEVYGIYNGYQGLIENKIKPLDSYSVSNIIQRGGTILKSARSEQFMFEEGRKIAFNNLKLNELDGLVAIGGDGTFTGAKVFGKEYGVPIIGIAGTIDNDLYGTDFTLGYDTAINTVVEVVDKIRDTAGSHNRLFVVEVMGRDAGIIALRSAVGVGAEAVLVPETETYIDELINRLETGRRANKTSGIIIVAEGDQSGGAYNVAEAIKQQFDFYEIRVSVIGHMQRGGSPTAMDRVLGSKLGYEAVHGLLNGRNGEMVGVIDNKIVYTAFEKAIKQHQGLDESLLELVNVLS